MKAYLVWKDGRREATEWGGALRIHCPRRVGERDLETVFHVDKASAEKGPLLYMEGETSDVTEANKKSARRYAEMIAEMKRQERASLAAIGAVKDCVAKAATGELSAPQAIKQIRELLT